MNKPIWVILPNITIIYSTAKAYRISIGDIEEWIPKSLCMEDDYSENELIDIVVKEWIVAKKPDLEYLAEFYEGEAYDSEHR